MKPAHRTAQLLALLISPLLVAGCKPPAADDYVERVNFAQAKGAASAPLPSPDVTDAVWAEGARPDRIIYGIPGKAPLLALDCAQAKGDSAPEARHIRITRFAPADAGAKALLALIGNGHISRLKIDATWNGRAWLWQGTYPASSLQLEVLTGPHAVTATLPGAGKLDLGPSPLPARLIDSCRADVPFKPAPIRAG